MATIPLVASGSSKGAGASVLTFKDPPRTRRVWAVGSGGSSGAVRLTITRGLGAVGTGRGVGRAKLSDPRARGTGTSAGTAQLSGKYHVRAAGAGISAGRASLEPHGSMSVIWIMKIR